MSLNYLPYLALQCARFRALSGAQACAVMKDRCQRTKTYKLLQELVDDGWLEFQMFPFYGPSVFWVPSRKLWNKLYSDFGFEKPKALRESDRSHTQAVFETVLRLARFEHVSGVATEYELSPKRMGDFIEGKTPDAILQIAEGTQSREIAVEVETSQKSMIRIRKIMQLYSKAFQDPNSRCTGAIFITSMFRVFTAYATAVRELPEEIQSRIIVAATEGLSELPDHVFGKSIEGPVQALENLRISYAGGATYDSVISRGWSLAEPFKGHICIDPVTNNENDQNHEGSLIA